SAADAHAFGGTPHQYGEGDTVQPQRLLKRRNGGALGVDQAFLLRSVERGRGTGLQSLLNQIEHARGAGDVVTRDAQSVLGGQNLKIGVSSSDDGGEADNLAVVTGGDGNFFGCAQCRPILPPEIDFVTRVERGP